ncbi:MAG: DUF1272 domain-containing protein [Pseudomonadota bacterium]|nr:DUF1272 domain-containing protein [Pseudomonadota bacterium]
MLSLRPSCECCDRDLAPDADNARICSFECTFCDSCADDILQNVCPNCGGGLERRPVRPKDKLANNPPSADRVSQPLTGAQAERHRALAARYAAVPPAQR